jgi:hypothetical protein
VARSRDRAYEGEADTIYLGCWPRAVFERFGGFDEQLVRNQDDEHNLRLRRQARACGKRAHPFGLSAARQSPAAVRPAACSTATGGPSFSPSTASPDRCGNWCRRCSWRRWPAQLAAPWWPGPLVLLLASYALYLAGAALAAARQAGDGCLLAHLPAVIATYHLGYGVGTWRGMLDVLLRRRTKEQWSRLTR